MNFSGKKPKWLADRKRRILRPQFKNLEAMRRRIDQKTTSEFIWELKANISSFFLAASIAKSCCFEYTSVCATK